MSVCTCVRWLVVWERGSECVCGREGVSVCVAGVVYLYVRVVCCCVYRRVSVIPAPPPQCPVFKGDLVEHHCQSSHGISPWLEACVSDVTPDGVRLGGGVIRTEPKRVVPRESVRLIQRGRGRLFRRLRLAAGHSKCSIM
ncbi:MAG: hypothetical protein P4L40_04325 [Terracidiphilus sp.]|nr:hypothetical protein [Terracidiphilus sp.]